LEFPVFEPHVGSFRKSLKHETYGKFRSKKPVNDITKNREIAKHETTPCFPALLAGKQLEVSDIFDSPSLSLQLFFARVSGVAAAAAAAVAAAATTATAPAAAAAAATTATAAAAATAATTATAAAAATAAVLYRKVNVTNKIPLVNPKT
jgi:hypothetical protein